MAQAPDQPVDGTMAIEEIQRDDCTVLKLRGPLKHNTDDTLLGKITLVMTRSAAKIIIDCSDLEYLNSKGASVFIAAHSQVMKGGGDLWLAGLKPDAQLVVDRLGISKVIRTAPTVDAAVEALSSY